MRRCFKECARLQAQSVAFPSLGAGILQYPSAVVAKIMSEEANAYLKSSTGSLKEVKFVIFMDDTYQEFQKLLGRAGGASGLGTSLMEVQMPFKPQATRQLPQKKPSASGPMGNIFQLQNNINIELVCGDITDSDSEAIVNSTNSDVQLTGGGVAGALLKKGGMKLQQMCNQAMEQKGVVLQEGEVLVTRSAGGLQCNFLFHIVFESKKYSSFVRTITACLKQAENQQCSTIAFPAIGTGAHGYPAAEAAKGMLKAFHQFAATGPVHVKKIRVFLFQLSVYNEMVGAFKDSESQSHDGFLKWVGRAILKGTRKAAEYVGWPSSGDVDMGSAVDSLVPNEREIHAEIQLTIYGQTNEAIEGAERQLHHYIEKEFESKRIEGRHINELPEKEVSKLRTVAAKHHVDFQINRHPLNYIRLQGSKASVNDVRDEVRKALNEFEVKLNKRKAADVLAKTIQWCYESDSNEFEPYDAEIILDIEEAYTTNKKGRFSHKSEEYGSISIDFSRMVEITDDGESVQVKRVDQTEQGNIYYVCSIG